MILRVHGKIFSLLKCAKCGLVYTSPMPTDHELLKYYQGFNFQKQPTKTLLARIPSICRSLRHFVGTSKISGRFLDYGGGSGIYALAAERLGWEADLYDCDEQMVEFARRELSVARAYTTLENVKGPYNVIFAFHVIEHWNDFDRNLKQLLSILAPGGSLLFATPNANSVEKSVRSAHRQSYRNILIKNGASEDQADFWMNQNDSITCWDPPRHLFAFTPQSFVEIGKRYSLETTIWTGFNTSEVFEPRSYVVPRYSESMIIAITGARAGNPKSAIRKFITDIRLRQRLQQLRKSHPHLGEQLYVKYSINS